MIVDYSLRISNYIKILFQNKIKLFEYDSRTEKYYYEVKIIIVVLNCI